MKYLLIFIFIILNSCAHNTIQKSIADQNFKGSVNDSYILLHDVENEQAHEFLVVLKDAFESTHMLKRIKGVYFHSNKHPDITARKRIQNRIKNSMSKYLIEVSVIKGMVMQGDLEMEMAVSIFDLKRGAKIYDAKISNRINRWDSYGELSEDFIQKIRVDLQSKKIFK